MTLNGKSNLIGVGIALTFAVTIGGTSSGSAITAEIAKKCDALVSKAFPPRHIGNPAAGSRKGSAAAQRDYFKKCVDKEGKMDPLPDAPK